LQPVSQVFPGNFFLPISPFANLFTCDPVFQLDVANTGLNRTFPMRDRLLLQAGQSLQPPNRFNQRNNDRLSRDYRERNLNRLSQKA
jgi:hypothetical protein